MYTNLRIALVVTAIIFMTMTVSAQVAVLGHAYLENQSDHSGIKVVFEKVSPSAVSDSTYTNADGSYSIALPVGIYIFNFTKDGYQPGQLPSRFLSGDTILQDVSLLVGSTQEVSGNVRGRLTKNVMYFVVGDLTVSSNDTLIIDPGTKVKFRGLYNMTVYGLLKAVGQEGDTILFTSSTSTPLPGDWGKISFNNAKTDCEISYAKILNATDGINATNTNVMKITHCIIDRIYSGNGITANNSSNSIFSYNTISNVTNGIVDQNGGNLTVRDNKITQFINWGLYFNGSPNSIVNHNFVEQKDIVSDISYAYGIGISNSVADSNTVLMYQNISGRYRYGISAWGTCEIRCNTVKLREQCSGRCIYAENNSTIVNNDVEMIHQWYCSGESTYAIYVTSGATVEKNNIRLTESPCRGIYAGLNTTVKDNIITDTLMVDNGGEWAMSIETGVQVLNNRIIIRGNSGGGILINVMPQTIMPTLIKENLIKLTWGNAIDFNVNSIVSIFNNTFVGNGSGTGLNVGSNSHPQVRHNIISNFSTGINAQSQIYDMMYNDVYGNSTNFTGSGLPQQTGQMVTTNARGTQSDIYYNISQHPLYKDTSKNDYSLQASSPCINAGDPNLIDPDGTTADIGAFFYDVGRTPYSVTIDTTYDATVKVSWQAVESESLQGYNMYRKISSESTYTYETSIPVGTNAYTFTNLTNNVSYDFAVTSVYQTRESNKSIKATTVPGIAKISLSPRTVEAVLPANDSVNVGVTIQNLGTKDLKYRFILSDYSYYRNNFDSTSLPSGWIDYACNGWRCNGGYLRNSNGCGGTILGGNSEWTDIVLEADVYVLQNRQSSIIVRAQDQSNYVELYFHPNSNQHIGWYVMKNGGRYNITSGYIGKGDGQWFHIKIIVAGSKYEAYVDGILRVSMDDGTYMAGKIGFWVSSSENLQLFDNLVVRSGYFQASNESTVQPAQQDATTISVSSRSYTPGNYLISPLTIGSNDAAKPIATLPVLLSVTGGATPPAPTYFHPVSPTGQPYTFAIASGKIDTSNLQAGDEIGIYDDTLCVGAGVFDGKYLYKLTAWQSANGQSGFTSGHPIKVRLYQSATRRLAGTTLTFSIGDGTFVPGEFSVASINGTVYTEQQTILTGNQFNLISFNRQPRTPAVTSVLQGVDSVKIAYDDKGGVYIPKYSINTINDVDFRKGYHIYISGSNDTIHFTGLKVVPSSWSLTLEAKKFNSIPFFGTANYPVTQAFSSITSSVKIIQSSDGTAWIPGESVNTLGNLVPGKGYQLFLNGTSNVSFAYPDVISPPSFSKISVSSSIAAARVDAQHFKFVKTGLPYLIVLRLPSPSIFETGDEVAAYDGMNCVGASVYESGNRLSVSAWKSNSDPAMPGYIAQNAIVLKFFRKSVNVEQAIAGTFDTPEEAVFDGAAYSCFTVSGVTSVLTENEIPKEFNLMQNYPNPFNPSTQIVFDLPKESMVTIAVYDVLGRKIATILQEVRSAGRHSIVWEGQTNNGATVGTGVFFYEMRANNYRSVKKMLLVK